jgi:hypothetical protein
MLAVMKKRCTTVDRLQRERTASNVEHEEMLAGKYGI